jgi:hypothetical protein
MGLSTRSVSQSKTTILIAKSKHGKNVKIVIMSSKDDVKVDNDEESFPNLSLHTQLDLTIIHPLPPHITPKTHALLGK